MSFRSTSNFEFRSRFHNDRSSFGRARIEATIKSIESNLVGKNLSQRRSLCERCRVPLNAASSCGCSNRGKVLDRFSSRRKVVMRLRHCLRYYLNRSSFVSEIKLGACSVPLFCRNVPSRSSFVEAVMAVPVPLLSSPRYSLLEKSRCYGTTRISTGQKTNRLSPSVDTMGRVNSIGDNSLSSCYAFVLQQPPSLQANRYRAEFDLSSLIWRSQQSNIRVFSFFFFLLFWKFRSSVFFSIISFLAIVTSRMNRRVWELLNERSFFMKKSPQYDYVLRWISCSAFYSSYLWQNLKHSL